MTAFVYVHIPSRRAWGQNVKTNMTPDIWGKVVFLFECPAQFNPKDQAQFNKACECFGFKCGPAYVWLPEIQQV